MGQAIVYCSNCSAQLRGADFEAQRAFKVDHLIFCAKCCREILGPDFTPAPSGPSTKAKSLSLLQNSTPSAGRNTFSPPAVSPAPRPGSGSSIWILAASGIGVFAVLIAMALSGGHERPASSSSLTPPVSVGPATAPSPSLRESAAQEALAKALRTTDLDSRRQLLVEAVAQAAGTSLLPDAQRELDLVNRKLDRSRAEKQAAPAGAEEERKAALLPAAPAALPAEPKPAPPPADPGRSPEVAARMAKWTAALLPASGRDYPAAIAALEKLGSSAEDLLLLQSVAALHQNAVQALVRTPKGTKLGIDARDASGAARRAEGSFVEEENGRIQLRCESGSLEVEVGEILPAWLADLWRSRGGAVDPAAAALFCLLEGDPAGARRLAGEKASAIPERYWNYAESLGATRDDARGLYHEAVALESHPATAADAVPRYLALLRDRSESPFVRRNKTLLASRARLSARDYLFVAGDFSSSGVFKAAKATKGNACWTSEADRDLSKVKDSYVEISYSVLPDLPYRCWIYAGACCQETFEFWVQGTEMKSGKEKESVEPGSGAAAIVKPWNPSLKKSHSGHAGPKQASHWEWVAIPLPVYAKPGLQQLRVCTANKGFSVAFACVSATRSSAPRELELRELEKARGDRGLPALIQAPKPVVLFSLSLDGTDRHLVGELRDKVLHGTSQYNACLAGVEGTPVFAMPPQGELRITYFLKSPTPLTARLRVSRGGEKSDAYDANILQPQSGRPAEARIPFSAFKEARGVPSPALAAGDPVVVVYISGEDMNCGLRIEVLSIVELKMEPSVRVPAADVATKIVYSEYFENGCGRFKNGEAVDGGVKGSKAISISTKGIESWGAWSVPIKASTTISFKLKPLGDVGRLEVMVWSEALKDNGRYFIEGLKKGEWKEVRFKATELRLGWSREGPSLNRLDNIKIFIRDAPEDLRVLLDDFEIRE